MWYNLQLTKLDIELAMENARSSKISLMNEVKKAYYSHLLMKESYAVLQLTYNNLVDNYNNISEKYEQGIISEFDKLRAEVQMKNQIPSVKSAEKQLELSTMILKVLIGVNLDEPLIFEGALQDYEEEMKVKALPDIRNLSLNNNSDIHQLDIALRQLEAGLKIIKSSSAPTLGLNIAWSYSAMDDSFKFNEYRWFPNSYVAVGLNIPIVSWAGAAYQIKSAKLNQANLQDQRNYLLDNLQVSVSNSISLISNAVEELNSNKETLIQAEKAYSIAKKQYDIGMGTWLDLNTAELVLTSSQLLYYQSIYNYLSAYADLEKTLGE
jgi:outer membrane protein TolC